MKLRLKLALSFTFILAGGALASVPVISAVVRTRMQAFVFEGDVERARNLASYLGDYYERSGSFDDAFAAVVPLVPDMPMPPRGRGPERGEGMGPAMRPRPGEPARVVLTDPGGRVLFSSRHGREEGVLMPDVVERGVAVEADDIVRGYVAVGSMIDPELRGLELSFLNSVSLAVLVSTLAAAVLAVAAGAILVAQITLPLRKLEGAVERVAAGDFGARVEPAGRDEIGRLAGNFNRMAGALEEQERLRRRMAEDAAHELRTPVSLLQANVEMMLEGVYPLDRENLLSLSEEIGRLARLVRDLDEQNRAGGLRKVDCALPAIITPLVVHFRPRLSEKRIEVATALPEDLPRVPADPEKLSRVFSNILSNAVRHVNAGGQIRVSAAAEPDGNHLVVTVENTGSYIPPEDLERIFERFYRADAARSREDGGSGLGLAISREIVRLHGGTITAENLSPDGVRFSVRLPV